MRLLYNPSLWVLPLIFIFYTGAASRLVGIPTLPFTASSDGAYSISSLKSLIVDTQFADSRDEDGETLIPPTLQEFATTFADDLSAIFDIALNVTLADAASTDSIFLTLGDLAEYVGASGAPTSEGYTLSVTSSGLTISGASSLGAFWGTRTVIQQAILSGGSLPYGEAKDAPGWRNRGMMLDAARHYYPPEFIIETCAYMSFFKQNLFHFHLSDNLYNNVNIYSRERSLSLYARFRLFSDAEEVAGLNPHKNESYTYEQFEEIQSKCAARGVTILPEIEAPGHALPIVQWKPELGLSDDLSLLNISHPDTIPTMKLIWGTFLDWFHSKTVSIGADEYTADANEYNRFVDEMASYIWQTSSKSIRIWGTFPPQPEYDNINQSVSIQHWAFFEDMPLQDYILNNYSVLNSDDTYYTVAKWSGSYPQTVNISRTFDGDPATGGIWKPYVFDTKNASNNPERSNPRVLGAVTPQWNDYGPNATVYSEAHYVWREGIPALADKQWGGDLSASEFATAFAALHPLIPGQNLERAIPSASPLIFSYSSAATSVRKSYGVLGVFTDTVLNDQSGNGYDATTDCPLSADDENGALEISDACSLATPLSSKGRDYTLTLKLRLDEVFDDGHDATLISGGDSALMLTPNLTLFASGSYYRLNSTVPRGSWVNVRLVGRGNQTLASVQGTTADAPVPTGAGGALADTEEEFLAVLGINGERFVWAPVAVEAPIARVGGEGAGWKGKFGGMSLSSEA
ncbi:glycoside hydrolase family 20 protein [Xylariomycetidae sp. FL2044]|nr:glycoside hydrolase family 20 protein [Xylariomycetidae sp. FL2044]